MSEYQVYIGATKTLIKDSADSRELVQKVVGEVVEWNNLVQNSYSQISGALQSFRDFVTNPKDPSDPNNAAIIYRRVGGSGPSRGLNSGDYLDNFNNMHHADGRTPLGITIWVPWNDRVNAIKVRDGYFMACYEHANFGGDRLLILGDAQIDDLPSLGWGDRISSAMVYPLYQIKKAW